MIAGTTGGATGTTAGAARRGGRVYCGDDVARIHRVLVYREPGLPLAEIGRVLAATWT